MYSDWMEEIIIYTAKSFIDTRDFVNFQPCFLFCFIQKPEIYVFMFLLWVKANSDK